jgi:hypothetical protein
MGNLTEPSISPFLVNESWHFSVNDTIQDNLTIMHEGPVSAYAYCQVAGMEYVIALLVVITIFLGVLTALRLWYFMYPGDGNN